MRTLECSISYFFNKLKMPINRQTEIQKILIKLTFSQLKTETTK